MNRFVQRGGGQPGKSTAAFFAEDGKEMQVDLVDGAYVLDEEDPVRRGYMTRSLIKAGFEPAAVAAAAEQKAADEAAARPGKTREMIRLMHPDNTPGNLIDATVSVGRKKLKVEAGYVETDDRAAVEALVKKGYIVQNPFALEPEAPSKENSE